MQLSRFHNRFSVSSAARTAPALFAFGTLLFATSAYAAPSGEDLLRAMAKAERTLAYSATETTMRSEGATMVARLQKSGGKQRLEYSAPAIMRGDLLIDDGQNLWRYHRAEKAALKTKTPTRDNSPNWNSMRKRMTATNSGRSTLGGRAAWVVVVASRDTKAALRKFWIDDKTKLRLRLQRFDSSGKTIETTTLSNLKIGAVPASAFRWTTLPGVKVSNAGTLYTRLEQARRKADWLRAPAKLPAGYAFESAVVNSDDAWLRYSNGARRFSIFQQRTSDKRSTPLRRAGSGWFWQKNGNRFLVAGATQAQAEVISKSVR